MINWIVNIIIDDKIDNPIGSKGAIMISKGLKNNSSLKRINMGCKRTIECFNKKDVKNQLI